jgi:hypothetical protein
MRLLLGRAFAWRHIAAPLSVGGDRRILIGEDLVEGPCLVTPHEAQSAPVLIVGNNKCGGGLDAESIPRCALVILLGAQGEADHLQVCGDPRLVVRNTRYVFHHNPMISVSWHITELISNTTSNTIQDKSYNIRSL